MDTQDEKRHIQILHKVFTSQMLQHKTQMDTQDEKRHLQILHKVFPSQLLQFGLKFYATIV